MCVCMCVCMCVLCACRYIRAHLCRLYAGMGGSETRLITWDTRRAHGKAKRDDTYYSPPFEQNGAVAAARAYAGCEKGWGGGCAAGIAFPLPPSSSM
ncbi:hypothetical protein GGS23DRAFT_560274 [Durotheca rogersii]|uniref:uncharacterized protein n=1 Tax=Durotheca rogersii TaxID=419775 RepID=UPI002220874B|nr:uncharacterized protein GGS23DRAFT_560274 [Durotheca rogersii]KAI5864466.1 hypothetical protein GGS23DRAFT_560274 [Durotheca rogersii]